MRGAGGVFTPQDTIWKVNRHAVLMLGGGRALLLQAAHPLALAGVLAHSDYSSGPWKRLERTMEATSTACFGRPEAAERVGRRVRAMHTKVNGTLAEPMGPFPAGTPYDARDPALLLWVHATLVDTALLMYRTYVGDLTHDEYDEYWQQMKVLARLFGCPDDALPGTYDDFRAYWTGMLASEEICVTPQACELAREVVLRPPLPAPVRPAWRLVNFATAGFLPAKLRRGYGFTWSAAHRGVLGGSAAILKHAVMPVLPDALRAERGLRRVERAMAA